MQRSYGEYSYHTSNASNRPVVHVPYGRGANLAMRACPAAAQLQYSGLSRRGLRRIVPRAGLGDSSGITPLLPPT